MTVAVVGGGIAGLAAAWELRDRDVVVLEATDRAGGKLRTGEVGGVLAEEGAEVVLATRPEAVELARAVGLGDDLVAPRTSEVSVWWRGRLHPLPAGLSLGVPTRLGPVLRSGLLSPAGVARAGLDLVLPRTGGVTVGELVGRRFGREVVERLVDPLLAGVYAGDADRLDAEVATPQLAEAARTHRSLLVGLSRQPRADGSVFVTVRGGMERLAEAIAAEVDVRTRWPVERLERVGGRWRVLGPEAVEADAVVVAAPAPAAARLVPGAGPALAAIPYASVALVTAVYPPGGADLRGSGLLVPRGQRRLVKAATWLTEKWDHLGGDGRVAVRASVGRHGDPSGLELDDDALVAAVTAELSDAAGLPPDPLAARVTRWEAAVPQYEPGHLDRVATILAALPPGVAVAGAYLQGVGVPACIASGYEAARAIR